MLDTIFDILWGVTKILGVVTLLVILSAVLLSTLRTWWGSFIRRQVDKTHDDE